VHLDLLLQRSFPALVGAMLATAAYFQATGLVALVADTLTSGELTSAPAAPRRPPMTELGSHATSAAPVLTRNPFDSATGPLDGSHRPDAAPTTPPAAGDPYVDPDCDAARVVLIVTSDDPAWSFAAIAASGPHPQLRRAGDEIGGRSVVAIARDRVWLASDGARCQARLGSKALAPVAPPSPAAPAARPGRDALPPEIASKIRKISETEFEVDRSALDMILEKQAELLRSTRMVPMKQDGRIAGLRLTRVGPDSLLGTLGLKSGDQLRSINGFDLSDPQKALEAYAKLRAASDLSVAVQRGGKDATISIHIR
jgi:general secretion pathway protein C